MLVTSLAVKFCLGQQCGKHWWANSVRTKTSAEPGVRATSLWLGRGDSGTGSLLTPLICNTLFARVVPLAACQHPRSQGWLSTFPIGNLSGLLQRDTRPRSELMTSTERHPPPSEQVTSQPGSPTFFLSEHMAGKLGCDQSLCKSFYILQKQNRSNIFFNAIIVKTYCSLLTTPAVTRTSMRVLGVFSESWRRVTWKALLNSSDAFIHKWLSSNVDFALIRCFAFFHFCHIVQNVKHSGKFLTFVNILIDHKTLWVT